MNGLVWSSAQRDHAREAWIGRNGDPSKRWRMRRPPSLVGDLMGPPGPGEDFGTVWIEAP